jgi:hypothetical protein
MSIFPSGFLNLFMHSKIVSIAMFVLPAPVGAQTSKFSQLLKALSNNLDYTTFNLVMPSGNALWVHSGN